MQVQQPIRPERNEADSGTKRNGEGLVAVHIVALLQINYSLPSMGSIYVGSPKVFC